VKEDVLPSSLLSKDVVWHCPVCLRERGEMICYAPRQRHCVVCQCEALEPLDLPHDEPALPTIPAVLADPAASSWIKRALSLALSVDPVDAANDAEFLALLLETRCVEILSDISSAGRTTS